MSSVRYTTFASPIGELTLACTDRGLHRLLFAEHRHQPHDRPDWRYAPRDPLLLRATKQTLGFLHGDSTPFSLPLAPEGTPFQLRVWQALENIGYGQTWSYAELAAHIGQPTAARAVGSANARNPLPLFRPCHRVIGAQGQLTGFAGGLAVKQALLRLEALQSPDQPCGRSS